jgi:phosphoribosylformylglycinamidine (FGAM) synthase-like enzyme
LVPGSSEDPHLVAGVVAGIGGYGNCVGVPTVGGETQFHEGLQRQHPGQCDGRRPRRADKIFYAARRTPGNPMVYVGSKTGRDGIHGATMASAEFSEAMKRSAPPSRSATRSPKSC